LPFYLLFFWMFSKFLVLLYTTTQYIFYVDYCNNADPITFTNVFFSEEIAVLCNLYRAKHGLINCVDIKAKCRYLKKLSCEGTLRQLFIRVYRLEIQSFMLNFRPSLWTVAPQTFFLVQFSPPLSPLPCVKVQCVQTVCGWERVGVLSPVGDHILQEFNTLYLNRFRTDKIARLPHTKNLGGEGASDR
jgi:hypothetical protein